MYSHSEGFYYLGMVLVLSQKFINAIAFLVIPTYIITIDPQGEEGGIDLV